MHAVLIRRFIEATQNVFGTMVGTNVTFGTPGPTGRDPVEADVSGIIGFSGDVAGAAVIRFPMATALGVVEALCGEAFGGESEDFSDAIGEIANMICGNAKSSLDGANVSISCPQVVLGKDHKVQRPSDAVSITIPCETPHGIFVIEVSVRAAAKASAARDQVTPAAAS
ncbi:MAG: chemotaxis protein CheX [Planctomycetota bacterium]|nr:chemotaxis protein CheX [Planctomycetota bacterium]